MLGNSIFLINVSFCSSGHLSKTKGIKNNEKDIASNSVVFDLYLDN